MTKEAPSIVNVTLHSSTMAATTSKILFDPKNGSANVLSYNTRGCILISLERNMF